MKIINYTEAINTQNKEIPAYFTHFHKSEKLLFFDIETTGFSARNTMLYLIGALWYEDGQIKIRQWFNEDGKSEADLLSAFDTFCKNFSMLVHFNGSGFDLPYLKQKAQLLHTAFCADVSMHQCDILKEIRSYKKIFNLDHMKQVSIEQYLGINRDDTYTGKELIHIYQCYAARPDDSREHTLLLHNHDDLLGMPQISQILNNKTFFEHLKPGDILLKETAVSAGKDKLNIVFHYPDYASLPNRIACSKNGIYLNASAQKANLQIPVMENTLKHFFNDYKNYYYLPLEDTAIHKSVAAFVDSEHKRKATKSTCYIKKTDAFIPCFSKENTDIFQLDTEDKTPYQLLDSVLSKDSQTLPDYVIQCLKTFTT